MELFPFQVIFVAWKIGHGEKMILRRLYGVQSRRLKPDCLNHMDHFKLSVMFSTAAFQLLVIQKCRVTLCCINFKWDLWIFLACMQNLTFLDSFSSCAKQFKMKYWTTSTAKLRKSMQKLKLWTRDIYIETSKNR